MTRPTRQTVAGRAYLDLQNRARCERRGTQELLTMYVVERWLARLGQSAYADDFVLKGGMLLASFGSRRPTVDADALARNLAADEKSVAARVSEIAAISDPDDGVEFLTETVSTSPIRDTAFYSGVRVVMIARIATARIKLRLDVNFGDPVTPAPRRVELPSLHPDATPARVLGYPIETVLAEKITTALELGQASTRVRDWADVYTLTGSQLVDFGLAREALESTASFRRTVLVPLSTAVGSLVDLRGSTYVAYRRGLGPDANRLPERFEEVVTSVVAFADPLINASGPGARWNPSTRQWDQRDK